MTAPASISQYCLDAWLHCENLLGSLESGTITFSNQTRRVLDECAALCLLTREALKAKVKNTGPYALLCVGICTECAEICARYAETGFQVCAEACAACATALTQILDLGSVI
jgi:hypothetical protein